MDPYWTKDCFKEANKYIFQLTFNIVMHNNIQSNKSNDSSVLEFFGNELHQKKIRKKIYTKQ